MDCKQVNGMLDLLMDGALDDGQREALEAHGRDCPACATAIRSTLQMKALFEQMEPEADVPLEAQARWRGAVRAEAKQRRQKRMWRWFASAAAALVVLVGIGAAFTLKGASKQDATLVKQSAAAPMEAENAVEPALASGSVSNARRDAAPGAVVEADGMADEVVAVEEAEAGMVAFEAEADADSAVPARQAPACEMALQVKDVDTACKRVCDLAQEYEAAADVQVVEDGGANVYVEIAAENAGDFMNAVAPMDESGNRVDVPAPKGSGQVLVLVALHG